MIVKFFILMVCLITYAHAGIADKQFSADAVITVPDAPKTSSKLYVGEDVVRTEVETQNGLIVDIIYPLKGKLIKLNPQLKQYVEIPVEKQTKAIQTKSNPCYHLQNANCVLLGDELINGHKTQKWQVITFKQGRNMRTLHWIDIDRQLAVREFFSDGSMAEMVLEKKETVNGRETEKWVRTLSRPDGSTVNSFQWYDPTLKISIREELPGGYVRELVNIKTGVQDTHLFEIPDDYHVMRRANSNTNQLNDIKR